MYVSLCNCLKITKKDLSKLKSLLWWTVGESDSRLSDANRLHYHYANGPQINHQLLRRGLLDSPK